jgi:3-deoxy-D-manno-octulosonic-acid transferase
LNPLWLGYNLLLHTLGNAAAALWQLSAAARSEALFWQGRLARYRPAPADAGKSRPRIWFHAASVGEVTGAVATLRAVRQRYPDSALWLTVGTLTGFHFAREQLGDVAAILPFPLDFPGVLRKALRLMQPELYVALESELWPNLFWLLRRAQIPAVLFNGRISPRSARHYALLRPLYQPIFRQFRWLAMHSAADRERAVSLGAAPERSLVLGSAKYDGLLARTARDTRSWWHERLSLDGATPVMVGGSLRGAECTALLQVFAALQPTQPRLVGIFAPRHREQLPNMERWLRARGIPFQFLTHLRECREPRTASVILVDQMGVLFDLYAVGQLIFCGGTLEPVGGHNLLEPAAWGKPVFYGPHVEKVEAERRSLEAAGAGFMVADAPALTQQWQHWSQHLPLLLARGAAAPRAIQRLGGVADRQVELILSVLQDLPTIESVPHDHA